MADCENDTTPPGRPDNDSREAIWSVPSGWGRPCFAAFGILTIAFTAFLVGYDLRDAASVAAGDMLAVVLRNVFPSGGAAAVTVIIIAEALQYIMATLDYLRSKWVKPLIDRYRAEGRAQGRVQGRAEMYEQLRQWLERREAAQQAGTPFDEPPPSPEEPQ